MIVFDLYAFVIGKTFKDVLAAKCVSCCRGVLWEFEDFATGVVNKQCTAGIALLLAPKRLI
jgi:hypothetical protein